MSFVKACSFRTVRGVSALAVESSPPRAREGPRTVEGVGGEGVWKGARRGGPVRVWEVGRRGEPMVE